MSTRRGFAIVVEAELLGSALTVITAHERVCTIDSGRCVH
ncbi:hypothetical protein ABH922_002609 [Rhodococcus sp. 27YEA15]